MCVKLPLENLKKDLNLGLYPPYPTSIYICRVTTALRVCGGKLRHNQMEYILS